MHIAVILVSAVLILLDLAEIASISNSIEALAPAFLAVTLLFVYVFGMLSKQLALGVDLGLDVVNYWRRPHESAVISRMPEVLAGVVGKIVTFAYQVDSIVAMILNGALQLSMTESDGKSGSGSSAASMATTGVAEKTDGDPSKIGTNSGYRIRGRMIQRFIDVLVEMMDSKKEKHDKDKKEEEVIKELFVVAHSQGSMIAIDGLQEAHRRGLLKNLKVKPILVTMGSPYTHLYSHYFPSSHPANPLGDSVHSSCLGKWVNIYRADDFIGTFIDDDGSANRSVINYRVGARGHTGYWNDLEVHQIFEKENIVVG